MYYHSFRNSDYTLCSSTYIFLMNFGSVFFFMQCQILFYNKNFKKATVQIHWLRRDESGVKWTGKMCDA